MDVAGRSCTFRCCGEFRIHKKEYTLEETSEESRGVWVSECDVDNRSASCVHDESEVTICAEQGLHQDDENARVPAIAVVGNVLAGCGGFVHLVFGTIVFSSLLFVSVWDALNHILTRYLISDERYESRRIEVR